MQFNKRLFCSYDSFKFIEETDLEQVTISLTSKNKILNILIGKNENLGYEVRVYKQNSLKLPTSECKICKSIGENDKYYSFFFSQDNFLTAKQFVDILLDYNPNLL